MIADILRSIVQRAFSGFVMVATVLMSLFFIGGRIGIAYSAAPSVINYQGYITNASGVQQTGTAPVTVRIYDAPTGGTLLYKENEGTVTITNGHFSIPVGQVGDVNGATAAASITDLPFDKTYYITVEFGAPFNTGQMTLAGGVRSALGVVPFAVTSYGALTSNGSAGIVASKGKLYFDTGTNQLFVNDGSLWKALEVTGANISSLNGLTGISQFLAVSATGTDVALSSVGSTHTIVIPTASGTARGLVSTTTLVHLPRLQ